MTIDAVSDTDNRGTRLDITFYVIVARDLVKRSLVAEGLRELGVVDKVLAGASKGLEGTFGTMRIGPEQYPKHRVALIHFELLSTGAVTLFPLVVLACAGFVRSFVVYGCLSIFFIACHFYARRKACL
jgi:hypothetical protein